jgi:hypothetical protein
VKNGLMSNLAAMAGSGQHWLRADVINIQV